MKELRLNINTFLIVLFIITGGTYTFGLAWNIVAIPTPFFKVTESLAMMLYLLFYVLVFNKTRIKYSQTPIKYLYFFIILFGLELIKNIVFAEGSLKSIIDGFKNFYTVFLIFPLIYTIRTKKQIKRFINIIIVLGVANALVYYFQFATGTIFAASSGSWQYGVFRVNHPGFNIIPIAMLLVLGRVLIPQKRDNHGLNIILLAFFIVAFLVSLSKGSITATLVSIFTILYFHNKKQLQNIILYIVMGLVGLFMALVFMYVSFDFKISSMFQRFEDEIENVSDDDYESKSSSGVRGNMMLVKMTYILMHHPLMGVGFVYYKPAEDEKKWMYYENPIAVVGDATYQNIIIVTGYVGLFLWLLLYYKIFKTAKDIFLGIKDRFLRALALSIIGMPIFGILHGFSSNYFSTRGFIFISLMSALSLWLFRLTLNKINENSNS